MSDFPSYKGRRPAVGWSDHMTGGWKSQFERVRRWHERLMHASPEDKGDFLYAFYENAFHLRDWLLDTNVVCPKDIEILFKSKVEMRLCRDLANSHKHFSLKNPSQSAPPSEMREYNPISISSVILSDGEKYDPVVLATTILKTWEEFIKSHVSP